MTNLQSHYQDGDSASGDLTIDNLLSTTSYDLEWRLCNNPFWNYNPGDDGDWVDGDCAVIHYNAYYDDMQNGVGFNAEDEYSYVGGNDDDVNNGLTTASITALIDQVNTVLDANGNVVTMPNNVDLEALHLISGGQYYIGAMLSVSGVSVTNAASQTFAYGHAGSAIISPDRNGNILENMDYVFDQYPNNMFSTSVVSSTLEWEITDVATSNVVTSGSQPATGNTMTETIPSATLPIGDYELKAWISVDGNTPPTMINSEISGEDTSIDLYWSDIGTQAYDPYYTHQFSVVDASFGTLASFTPALPTITMQNNEWATITSSVDQLNSGDLHKIEWRIYEQANPNVDILTGEEEWVAPPLAHTFTVNSNMITSVGDLCFEAELYVGSNGPFDSQSACWVQTAISATSDADSDGVIDSSDHCPLDAATNDVNADGCEDPVDSDQDGLPDIWEVGFGLDPNNPSDATDDGDNDGLTNLQEFAIMTSPISADTDMDTVNDGTDLCPLIPGTGADGCPVGPVNLPPTCDIFFSVEADGIVAQGDAVLPGILPGQTGLSIELPEGEYYIIAVCSDPEGDAVTVTLNNDAVTTGVSQATAGILVSISEGTNAEQSLTIDWTDGVNSLQTTVDVTLEEDSGGFSIPGFGFVIGILSITCALIIIRRDD